MIARNGPENHINTELFEAGDNTIDVIVWFDTTSYPRCAFPKNLQGRCIGPEHALPIFDRP